ncbi:MAG: hypothetical protein HYU65_04035 [Armatimonadetes bacterium]|nr:hypothetical protein [Armatimonadota bacterium]
MDRGELYAPRARALMARWVVRFTTAGMVLSVAVLVVSWVLSMALLVTSTRLFEAVFALP